MSQAECATASQRVAAEVRAWLARRNLSAQRAAEQIGWTQTYLSRRLTCAQMFSPDDLEELATLLHVPSAAFFDWPDEGDKWRPRRWSANAPSLPLALSHAAFT